MKTSLHWLQSFFPDQTPLDPQQVARVLTHAGLPVESIESHGDDTILDVEITSNRGDCLSHLGIARELAALLNLPLQIPKLPAPIPGPPPLPVTIDAPTLCPHYTARLIRGVTVKPSPPWLAQRLESIGLRPINNIVDVTNFVLFELGQPLHAFDFAKLAGSQIRARTARKGETLISIDGKKHQLAPDMLIIADRDNPVALAGVMGGLDSEVTAATHDILLESARFDPLSVRKTSRALAMKSDSSYRFERGIDPTLPHRASLRAAELILQTAGGTLVPGIAEAGAEGHTPKKITLRLPRLRQILGVEFPPAEIMNVFARLNLSPVQRDQTIETTIPPHRLDLTQEIDLIEEAARVLGYDRIPVRDEISIRLAPPHREGATIDTLCRVFAAAGYFEAITFSFVSDSLKTDFGDSKLRADPAVRKADASLRPSLLPGLLESLRFNQSHGAAGVRLFEIGATFHANPTGIDEQRTVAWVAQADELRSSFGLAESLLKKLDASRPVTVQTDRRPGFAPGECAKILWGDHPIGWAGRIDPPIAQKLSLKSPPIAGELYLSSLLAGHKLVPQLQEIPRFPSVRRDLSLILKQSVRYAQVEKAVRQLSLPDLDSIDFVTTYRGKPLDPATKSMTITLVFRSPATTLKSSDVDAAVQKAVAALHESLDATLRA